MKNKNLIERLPLTGLEEGEFTQITPKIREIANIINSQEELSNFSIPEKISRWIVKNVAYPPLRVLRKEERRSRTAEQILKSHYTNSCSDRGTIFATLNRALGIPALCVETLNEETLGKIKKPWLDGHIFVDISQNGIWIPYEPNTPNPLMNYNLRARRYLPFARGVDFSKMYLIDKESGFYFQEPLRIQPDDQENIAIKFFGWRPN